MAKPDLKQVVPVEEMTGGDKKDIALLKEKIQ